MNLARNNGVINRIMAEEAPCDNCPFDKICQEHFESCDQFYAYANQKKWRKLDKQPTPEKYQQMFKTTCEDEEENG